MSIAVTFKAIKPSKLKVAALRLELLNGMRKAGRGMEKDFKATTKTWTRQPVFKTVISLGRKGPEVLVGTDDPIYRYVSEGTKPHIIRPVRASALHFRGGAYRAKTTPGTISSRGGGASGGSVYAQVVHHPGTEARNFGAVIARKWRKPFKREMEAAMRRAAKKSGHSVR